MEYTKCLVELDEILNYISAENLEKIPLEIRNGIKEQKDKEYIWKYDETKELKEQKLDRTTIAMLSYLNMEYLLNDEQKEYMENLHKINEQKAEKEKLDKYNPDDLFKRKEQVIALNNEVISKDVAMVEYKETFFRKFINRIKMFFRRNNS